MDDVLDLNVSNLHLFQGHFLGVRPHHASPLTASTPLDETIIHGNGSHLGLPVVWRIRVKGDGSFLEELVTPELRHRVGYSGPTRGGNVWEMDDSGVSRQLDLDDHEAILLGIWLRTGAWLHPSVQSLLTMRRVSLDEAFRGRETLLDRFLTATTSQNDKKEEDEEEDERLLEQERGMGVVGASVSAAATSSSSSSSSANVLFAPPSSSITSSTPCPTPSSLDNGTDHPSSSSSSSSSSRLLNVLSVQLKNCRVSATVIIDASSNLPIGFLMPLAGEVEMWRLDQWRQQEMIGAEQVEGELTMQPASSSSSSSSSNGNQVNDDAARLYATYSPTSSTSSRFSSSHLFFPSHTRHWGAAGGTNDYRTRGMTLRSWLVDAVETLDAYYLQPPSVLLPQDATFLYTRRQEERHYASQSMPAATSSSSSTTTTSTSTTTTPLYSDTFIDATDSPFHIIAYRTSSGHLLVRPRINGRDDLGLMLLDTGAGGLVIEKSVADALQLKKFGEIHISGVTGCVPSTFRRGNELRLGPLVMQQPEFMEMSVRGLVTGAPGPVVGIIGYDVLQRCVMDVPEGGKWAVESLVEVEQEGSRGMERFDFLSSLSSWDEGKKRRRGAEGVKVKSSQFRHVPAMMHEDEKEEEEDNEAGVKDNEEGEEETVWSKWTSGFKWKSAPSSSSPSPSSSSLPSPPPRGRRHPPPRRSFGHDWEQVEIGIFPPSHDMLDTSPFLAPFFVPFRPVSLLPHAACDFVLPDGRVENGLFMLDSGAGGCDVMLPQRVVRDLDMERRRVEEAERQDGGVALFSTATMTTTSTSSTSSMTREIRGIGGDASSSMQVKSLQLPRLSLSSQDYDDISALIVDRGGFDLSVYTSGVICGELLARCRFVMDYPRRRVAFIPPTAVLDEMKRRITSMHHSSSV